MNRRRAIPPNTRPAGRGRLRVGRWAWLLVAAGCTPGPEGAGTIVFSALEDGGCVTARLESPPGNLDRLVVAVVDGEERELAARTVPARELREGGPVLLSGVPPGTWRIRIAGCLGREATWWTEDRALRVEADTKALPLWTLRPVEGASCVGGENRHPLASSFTGDQFIVEGRMAFGAAAGGPGGRVLVAGGARALESGYTLSGGRGIWEFLPSSGLFLAVRAPDGGRLQLGVGRIGHGMAFLDARRVAVFGGASRAVLAPAGFPGREPSLRPEEGTGTALEVVDLESGDVSSRAVPVLPLWPAVAAWRDPEGEARALVAAGGMNRGDRSPSEAIFHWLSDSLDTPTEGRMVHRRYGASATFLSGGEVLVVGGWDGTAAPAPELGRPGPGGTWLAEALEGEWPPEGIAPSAFPVLAVLSDDGHAARVLVMGGNPLGAQLDWNNPDTFRSWQKASAWILTLEAREGAYRAGGGRVERVELEDQEETLGFRSLAALPRWPGRDGGPRWLLAGGYRSFSSLGQRSPPDCRNGDGTSKDWCFPGQVPVLGWDGNGLIRPGTIADRSRLGAAVAELPGGEVLIVGGLSGFGGTAGGEWVESTGLLVTPGDLRKDALCAAHP